MELLGIIIGIAVCYLIWPFIEKWLFKVTEKNKLPPPKDISEDVWRDLVYPQSTDVDKKGYIEQIKKFPTEPGIWLGVLERLLSFAAFFVNAPIVVAGWFAFKVASKWQVWANVVQVPKSLEKEEENTDIEKTISYIKARHRWGALLLMRFLIGTLSNVLIGFALAYVIKYFIC